MDASDLLPHRTALIGAAVALAIGLAGGLTMKVGAQAAPETETAFVDQLSSPQAEQIAWPIGKVPDYVIGSDFLRAQQPEPPVVVASYEVPEYVPTVEPTAWSGPAPEVQPVRVAETRERSWPSVSGDILNTRLPEDAPYAPEPPEAIDAPEAPAATAPMTLAVVE
jgi:hypothetical protein